MCYTTDVKKAKKKPDVAKPHPANEMIEFTRRLLNVRKSEIDELRKRAKPTAKRRP